MKSNKKLIALVCTVLLMVGAAGATLAWLTDQTNEVKNTFTAGNIGIDLTESKNDFKMIPGFTIDKDPVVTVEAGSEACWLFVKVTKSANFDDYLTYTPGEDWTLLTNDGIEDNNVAVYYLEQPAVAKDTAADALPKYPVLKDSKVTVLNSVEKEDMDAIDGVLAEGQTTPTADQELAARPTLTFKAYATQYYETNGEPFAVEKAWELAKTL